MMGDAPTIFIVDSSAMIRETTRHLLQENSYRVESFADGPTFLRAYQAGRHGCILIDAVLPGMGGIALLRQLKAIGITLPVVMMSANPPLQIAVEAMKAGAVDFIEKPLESELLLATVATALKQARAQENRLDYRQDAVRRISNLTKRQHEILDLVVAGHPTKNIAADLHLSQRTVENHRAAIARKTCSKSLPALIQTAICASCSIRGQSAQHSHDASLNGRAADGDVLH